MPWCVCARWEELDPLEKSSKRNRIVEWDVTIEENGGLWNCTMKTPDTETQMAWNGRRLILELRINMKANRGVDGVLSRRLSCWRQQQLWQSYVTRSAVILWEHNADEGYTSTSFEKMNLCKCLTNEWLSDEYQIGSRQIRICLHIKICYFSYGSFSYYSISLFDFSWTFAATLSDQTKMFNYGVTSKNRRRLSTWSLIRFITKAEFPLKKQPEIFVLLFMLLRQILSLFVQNRIDLSSLTAVC